MTVDHDAIAIRHIKTLKASLASFGTLDAQTVHYAMLMAMLDVETQMASQVIDAEVQVDFLESWIVANHPDVLDMEPDPARMAVTLIQRYRDQADRLAVDIEALQTDTNAEVTQLTADLSARDRQIDYQRVRITELESQAGALRVSLTEKDAEIQRYRDEIQRLTVRCQDLAAQLETSRARVDELVAVVTPGPAATVTATNGNARPALAVIEWTGIDPTYAGVVAKLEAGKLPGWTVLDMPQRRAIALYVIKQIANQMGDRPTMSAYEAARPAWMPTATAIAKMFSGSWVDVVSEAVAHA